MLELPDAANPRQDSQFSPPFIYTPSPLLHITSEWRGRGWPQGRGCLHWSKFILLGDQAVVMQYSNTTASAISCHQTNGPSRKTNLYYLANGCFSVFSCINNKLTSIYAFEMQHTIPYIILKTDIPFGHATLHLLTVHPWGFKLNWNTVLFLSSMYWQLL